MIKAYTWKIDVDSYELEIRAGISIGCIKVLCLEK